ncbi:hypothetical protein HG536_0A04100 [Torulaspora globosa]|uniref:non-specific serine/threonine protein kinase n=1 Tax=Torulaspora globosa TaxID=48254 RepID=A0A7G3ZAQ6_9SACH|nr:uncharacterized protein HG536_0A04100 [Torulaspora globosa]QLL30592.1 hypothetical protein HG536_0A04100 [Torulaspora globosa]
MAGGTPKRTAAKSSHSSSVAKKAARNAMLKVAGTTKVSPTQLERVVQSVNDATKRLSQPDSILSTSTTTKSSKRKSRDTVGPWKLGKTLGKGSSGRVRLAKNMQTGQLAAIKIVPKRNNLQSKDEVSSTLSVSYASNCSNASTTLNTTANNYNNAGHSTVASNSYGIEREIVIMKLISHSNVLGLYEVWENKAELYLVLEYVDGGELFDYLVSKGRLGEREAVHYFKQIIQGVSYCHSFNICHRDLKPENLLLDKKNKTIKIADFGMAALEVSNKLLQTSCGSPHYASPEIVMGKSYHGGPSDVWSCGIILFALLTGHLPFNDDNIKKLLLKVQSGKYQMPQNLSAEARDLIAKILVVNPARRLTTEEILAHPLIVKYDGVAKPKKPRAMGNHMAQGKSNSDLHLLNSYGSKTISFTSKKDIDESILNNLQILWHGAARELIVAKLLQPKMSEEKIFYALLLKYKENHMKKQPADAEQPKEQIFNVPTGKTHGSEESQENTGIPKLIQKSEFSVPVIEQEGNDETVLPLPFASIPPAIPVFTASNSRTFKKSGSLLSLQSQKSLSGKDPLRSSSRKSLSRSNSKKTLQKSASKRSLYSSASISKRSLNLKDYVLTDNDFESNQLPPLPSLDSTNGFEYLCEQLLFGNGLDKILEEEEEEDKSVASRRARTGSSSSNTAFRGDLNDDGLLSINESFRPAFLFSSEKSVESNDRMDDNRAKEFMAKMPLQDITNTHTQSRTPRSKLKRDISQKSNLSNILDHKTIKKEYDLSSNSGLRASSVGQHSDPVHSLDPRRNVSQPVSSNVVESLLRGFRSASGSKSRGSDADWAYSRGSIFREENKSTNFLASPLGHEQPSAKESYMDADIKSSELDFLAHSSAVQKDHSDLSHISFNTSATFKDLGAYLHEVNESYASQTRSSLKPKSRKATIKTDYSRKNLAVRRGNNSLNSKGHHSHNCSVASYDVDIMSDMSFAMEIPTNTFSAQAVTISNRGSAEQVIADRENNQAEYQKESANLLTYTPTTTYEEKKMNIFEDPPVESDSIEVTSSESDSSPNIHRKAVSIDTLNTTNVLPPTTNVRVSLYVNNNQSSAAALPRETTEQIISKFKLSPEKTLEPVIQKRFSSAASKKDSYILHRSESKLAMFKDIDEEEEAQHSGPSDIPNTSIKDSSSNPRATQPYRVTMLFDGEEAEQDGPASSEPLAQESKSTAPHDFDAKPGKGHTLEAAVPKREIKQKPASQSLSSRDGRPKQNWISRIFGGLKQKSDEQKFVKRHITSISFDDAHTLTLNEFDKNEIDYLLKTCERRGGREKVEYDCKFTTGNFKFKIKIESDASTIITVKRKGRSRGQHAASAFEIFNGDVAKVISQAEKKTAAA